MLDLFVSSEFLSSILSTGWSTLRVVLIGAVVVWVYTTWKQSQPFFQSLHMSLNYAFFFMIAFYSLTSSLAIERKDFLNPSAGISTYFFASGDLYQAERLFTFAMTFWLSLVYPFFCTHQYLRRDMELNRHL